MKAAAVRVLVDARDDVDAPTVELPDSEWANHFASGHDSATLQRVFAAIAANSDVLPVVTARMVEYVLNGNEELYLSL